MIEDKAIGLKIAENPEEVFWHQMETKLKQQNIINKCEIEMNELLIKHIESKKQPQQ